jgi:zinc transport system ATP-binding protein
MQRVLIARALAGEVRVLFLDEPTASVDPKAERNIFDLLNHLHQRMPIVLVSHDVSYISKFVNKVACINKKLVCHTTKELSDIDISEVYGYGVKHVHHNHPEV